METESSRWNATPTLDFKLRRLTACGGDPPFPSSRSQAVATLNWLVEDKPAYPVRLPKLRYLRHLIPTFPQDLFMHGAVDHSRRCSNRHLCDCFHPQTGLTRISIIQRLKRPDVLMQGTTGVRRRRGCRQEPNKHGQATSQIASQVQKADIEHCYCAYVGPGSM